ncbi:MAG: efflux transporter outer membrane subunit, partial [Paralcaligenes sp.]
MLNPIKNILKASAVLMLAVLLGACAVGPDYRRPSIAVGTNFKETKGWIQASPSDTALRADWWRSYNDPVLNRLMDDLLAANQNIAQAQAQYRQAQALVQSARAGFFPTLNAGLSTTRSGGSHSNSSLSGSDSSGSTQSSLTGSVSWEPDIWGKIRRTVESGEAGVEASAADLAATRLSMQSTLAQSYFQLRALDAEKRLYDQTLGAYERSLRTTQNRYQAGVAAQADVAAAQTQLENARTQALDLNWQRAQFEHALAVLTGQAPAHFAVAPSQNVGTVPDIPPGLPSQLLERRPDVAGAERRTAQANAQIGVAQAAWFPDLTLSGNAGLTGSQWAAWLSAPMSFWSLGPALALTIFDGGARESKVAQARATYDAQVAAYRLTVLTALQEVENYLVQLHVLGQEQVTQGRALAAARESLRLTENQYKAGLIDYLSVSQV